MAQISYIKYSDVKEAVRFDAEFFKPEYLNIVRILKIINSEKFNDNINEITGGATPLGAEYASKGIPFLRVQNIMQNYINDSDIVYLTKSQDNEIKRSRLKLGDVLLTITGVSYGKSAVVSEEFVNSNINQHSVRMKFDSKLKPFYISTFLNSKYGKKQSDKYITGLSRPALDYEAIKKFLIPVLRDTFQIKIESIVQKALFKLKQSQVQLFEAEDILLSEIGLKKHQSEEWIAFSISSNEIKESNRIDSEYYQPKYYETINKIVKYKFGFDTIRNQFKQNTSISKRDSEFYNYIEISDVNISNGEITPELIRAEDVPANGKRKLECGDLLVSKVRPNRGAVTFIGFEADNLIGSGAFTVLHEKTDYKKEVLMVFLKTKHIKELLLRYNCGTSYPVIKDDDILNMKIPLIRKEIQEQIAEKVQESFKLRKESKELLEKAKKMVEEEIEKEAGN